MRDELASGWKVSQVEALIDLPRRDIQRACYEGPGGIGIVRPQNTSWGWRVYEVADVAKLFLLAQARRRSQTLEEACASLRRAKTRRTWLAPSSYASNVRETLATPRLALLWQLVR